MNDIIDLGDDDFISCGSSDQYLSFISEDDNEAYCLEENLKTVFSTNPTCLNIVHINAQSIPAHYSDLLTSFNNIAVDCILVSESWLKPSLSSALFPLPGFTLIRNDRIHGRGGGVCVYIKEGLSYRILGQSSNDINDLFEYLFIEINFAHNRVLTGVIYSPSPSANYFTPLEILLETYISCYEHIIIMGDFNTCLLKNNHRSLKLQSLVKSLNMQLLPLNATHFSPNCQPSLLDLIILSQPVKAISYGQFGTPFSYHDLLHLSYKIRNPKVRAKVVLRRSLAGINVEYLRHDFGSVNWSELYAVEGIDEKINYFTTVVTEIFDKHAPLKPVRMKRLPAPWLTPEIRSMMKRRDKAKHVWRRNSTENNLLIYKKLRNKCNSMCRFAKRRHIHSVIQNSSMTETWRFLKVLGIGKSNHGVCSPIDPNTINKYFSTSPCYLSPPVKEQCLKNLARNKNMNRSFTFNCVTETDVLKYFHSLSSNASGCDGLNKAMLSLVADLIISVLTHIINYSLHNNVFPSSWKMAHVTLLPKKDTPISPSDFRPISILPLMSKILENIVSQQLSTFLAENKLLNSFQSGFRPLHSTTTALLKVTEDIRLAIDRKMLTVIVLLDFSNAFNSVDHDILLGILDSLGIERSTLGWFDAYLRGRQQRIYTNEYHSDWMTLSAGVPQGGVLSPLLFSIFINEVTKVLSSSYHLYADDLQIYRNTNVVNLSDTIQEINLHLQRINDWAGSFGLLVNPAKSQALIIGSRYIRRKENKRRREQ